MTKINQADGILAETMKMVESISDYLAIEYKNVKPFDRREISKEEQLYNYGQMTQQDMLGMIKTQGYEYTNQYIAENELLKKKTMERRNK